MLRPRGPRLRTPHTHPRRDTRVTVEIIFEYHSTSTDNEAGVASGWSDPPLSAKGRAVAKELGERRQGEQIDAVFCSDLRRAIETAEIAFGKRIPIHADHRLREY